MKKHHQLIALGVLALTLVAVGCGKQKSCRCSVRGQATVRIFEIDKGQCEDLHVWNYHTPLDSLEVDSLLCTDYEFLIDSIFNEE